VDLDRIRASDPIHPTLSPHPISVVSVANYWPTFSARSDKKFGRWRKSSAHHKIYSYKIIVFQRFTMQKVVEKIKYISGMLFSVENICGKPNYSTKKFGPFLINLTNFGPQVFPVPIKISFCPFFVFFFVAEILSPWQH
jgi:hypothetical protein